jgi:hypothetical protein
MGQAWLQTSKMTWIAVLYHQHLRVLSLDYKLERMIPEVPEHPIIMRCCWHPIYLFTMLLAVLLLRVLASSEPFIMYDMALDFCKGKYLITTMVPLHWLFFCAKPQLPSQIKLEEGVQRVVELLESVAITLVSVVRSF